MGIGYAKKYREDQASAQANEQRELMKLRLRRADVNEREITLEVYALSEATLPEKVGIEGDVVRMRPEWLPRAGAIRRYSNPSLCH